MSILKTDSLDYFRDFLKNSGGRLMKASFVGLSITILTGLAFSIFGTPLGQPIPFIGALLSVCLLTFLTGLNLKYISEDCLSKKDMELSSTILKVTLISCISGLIMGLLLITASIGLLKPVNYEGFLWLTSSITVLSILIEFMICADYNRD